MTAQAASGAIAQQTSARQLAAEPAADGSRLWTRDAQLSPLADDIDWAYEAEDPRDAIFAGGLW